MNKHLTKLCGAGALSLAAMTSMPASAVEVASTQFACPPDTGFTDCYAGAVVGIGSDRSFSDLEIGSFTVGEGLSIVLGSFHDKWMKLTSLTLSNSDMSFTSDGKHGDFSFDDVASGTYEVSISGKLKHPDRFPKMFGHDDFSFRAGLYGGGLVAQIPEPETYALMAAGLLTMFGLSRRRAQQQQQG